MSTAKAFAVLLAGLFIFAGGIALSLSVWNECRAGGNSVLYCMKLISR